LKKRIVFILGSLNIGGAEKVMINYLNGFKSLYEDIYHVEVFLIAKDGDLLNYLNPEIPINFLYRGNKFLPKNLILNSLYKLYRKLLSISFKKFPHLFNIFYPNFKSFDFGFIFVQDLIFLSNANFGLKKLIWIQNNLNKVENKNIYSKKSLENNFDFVIANSNGIYNDIRKRLNMSTKKLKLCYNPVDLEKVISLSKQKIIENKFSDRPYIVSVGRAVEQKRFDRLIDSFEMFCLDYNVDLVIVGDGELLSNLVSIVEKKSLSDRVFFTGNLSNPYPVISNALMFVCSSQYEGLPTAMIEAMALGIPIVSTPCEYGPLEILNYGEFGVLSDGMSPKALERAIRVLLESDSKLRTFKSKSKARSMNFSTSHAISNLIQIIEG